jgi:hypothetical protein
MIRKNILFTSAASSLSLWYLEMIEHVKEVLNVGEVVNGLIVGPSHSVCGWRTSVSMKTRELPRPRDQWRWRIG